MADGFTLVGADHTMIWLGNPDADWPQPRSDSEPLELHPPEGLYLFAGTHTGLVGVRLSLHESEPTLDRAAWPDSQVVVTDLKATEFCAIPPGGLGDVAEIVLPHPGRYVVRAAWNVRPGPNESVSAGAERYLIDIWPAREQ